MKLIIPRKRKDLESNPKLKKRYEGFVQLIDELNEREIPQLVIQQLNRQIEELNGIAHGNKQFSKEIGKKKSSIIKILEKELKIVPKNYYRNQWMILGMTIFGVPMGVVMGSALGNMAFIGIGIPIGMTIGLGVGSGMDEKAKKEGRQLTVSHDF